MDRMIFVTPKRVQDAYRSIGFKPMFGSWCSTRDRTCCPLTALALAHQSKGDPQIVLDILDELEKQHPAHPSMILDSLPEPLRSHETYFGTFFVKFDRFGEEDLRGNDLEAFRDEQIETIERHHGVPKDVLDPRSQAIRDAYSVYMALFHSDVDVEVTAA